MEPGTDPTRTDAGGPADNLIRITITLNPATTTISITENVRDPILFYGILEQARQIFARRQEQRVGAAIAPPKRPLVLPPRN